jgi:hypothetical protein
MRLGDRAVFAEIVDADDMVPMPEQFGDDITRNEAGGRRRRMSLVRLGHNG